MIPATIILAAGSMFILWLGERITDKGIGNGVSLIIMIGIIARLPQAFIQEVAKNLLSSVTLSGSTKTGFTFSDVSSDDSDWCNTYYTQDRETAGQGRWRIPNEREFGLMVKHLGDAMLNTRARTVYYRQYDNSPVNAGYVYLSEGGNTVLTTAYEYSSRAFSIRCVRDAISPSTVNN